MKTYQKRWIFYLVAMFGLVAYVEVSYWLLKLLGLLMICFVMMHISEHIFKDSIVNKEIKTEKLKNNVSFKNTLFGRRPIDFKDLGKIGSLWNSTRYLCPYCCKRARLAMNGNDRIVYCPRCMWWNRKSISD